MIARISGKAAAPGRERRWYVLWLILAMAVLAPLAVPGQKAGKATKKLAEAHAAGHAGGTADYVAYWVPKAAIAGMGTAFLLLLGTRWLAGAGDTLAGWATAFSSTKPEVRMDPDGDDGGGNARQWDSQCSPAKLWALGR